MGVGVGVVADWLFLAGMYHSGIGGGGFMLVHAADGSFESIDFRETAPAASFEDMYKNNTRASVLGGLASGVPGEVRGLDYLHKKYGLLPWETLLQPAIKTARDGFPVTEDLVRYMEVAVGSGEDFLAKSPTWALDFAPNGTRLGLGDIITRKRYADTLETIAQRGADAFYHGPIAETMVKAVQAAGGNMELGDLRKYEVVIQNVSQIDYRGFKVTSTTSPSSGAVALAVLKILDTYDDFLAPDNTNLSTHRLDEAIRFGYGLVRAIPSPKLISSDAPVTLILTGCVVSANKSRRPRLSRRPEGVRGENAGRVDHQRYPGQDIRFAHPQCVGL